WPRPRVSALLHNPTHVSGQERVNALGGQRGAILDVVAVVDTGYVMMFTQHPGPLESAGVAHGLVAQCVVLGRDHDSRCHPGEVLGVGSPRRRDQRVLARGRVRGVAETEHPTRTDRKSTRLNSSHVSISYAVFCL